MKNKYNYVYIVAILAIVLTLVLVKEINDMIEMGLYASAIVLTSIFTYSNRKTRIDNQMAKPEENTPDGRKE